MDYLICLMELVSLLFQLRGFFTLEWGNEVTINYEKQVNWILSYQVLIPKKKNYLVLELNF